MPEVLEKELEERSLAYQKNDVYFLKDVLSSNNLASIISGGTQELEKNFYHYTKIDSVLKILKPDEKGNRFFHVRNIAEMNDLAETEIHKKDSKKIHIFCTCSTSSEKIPLWYLYSGVCGNGARIGITPARMLWFLEDIKTVYPVRNNQVDYSTPLSIGKDFDLECGWVCYVMKGDKKCLFKNQLYSVHTITPEMKEANFFIKEYPWEYEREFRIVVINKTKEVFEKIALPISERIIPMIEIASAPEKVFSKK